MRTHGKRYNEAAARRDLAVQYQPRQAIEIMKAAAFAKFDETVEISVRLGVDPKHADQLVRGTVVLPAGTGASVRVLVIAVGEKAREAQAAGADYVGAEYVAKIEENWFDFDVMSQRDARPGMGQVGQLGRLLGPRGLMPNPKAGTVTSTSSGPCARSRPARSSSASTKGAISTPRSAKCRSPWMPWRSETNSRAFIDQVVRSRPPAAKGVYIRKVAISSAMGPGSSSTRRPTAPNDGITDTSCNAQRSRSWSTT